MEQVKSKRSEQSCTQSTHLGDDNAVVLLSTQIHALAAFFVPGTNSQKKQHGKEVTEKFAKIMAL